MIRCSVCGEWFEPYTPLYRMSSGAGCTREDGPEPICYNCLESIDSAIYDDPGLVEEAEDDEE